MLFQGSIFTDDPGAIDETALFAQLTAHIQNAPPPDGSRTPLSKLERISLRETHRPRRHVVTKVYLPCACTKGTATFESERDYERGWKVLWRCVKCHRVKDSLQVRLATVAEKYRRYYGSWIYNPKKRRTEQC